MVSALGKDPERAVQTSRASRDESGAFWELGAAGAGVGVWGVLVSWRAVSLVVLGVDGTGSWDSWLVAALRVMRLR